MQLSGVACVVLGAYLVIQLVIVFATSVRPTTPGLGIVWTALTFLVLPALA